MKLNNFRFEKEDGCLWIIINENDHGKLYPDEVNKLAKFITKKENKSLHEKLKVAVEAMKMGAFHHQACDANWYSDQVDEEKVRAGIPDPRKAKDCTCARRKIDEALEKIGEVEQHAI